MRGVPETRMPEWRDAHDEVPMRRLAAVMTCYGLFGAGYIAYMTFIVAYLNAAGATSAGITLFWSVLGIAAVIGAFAWRPVLSSLRGGVSTALVLTVLVTGAVLPVLSVGPLVTYLSALLFGVAFLNVVTAVTITARNSLPQHQWTSAIAKLTVVFALGQCAGPLLSGILSDGPGGMRSGLLIGVALLLAAIPTALAQRTARTPAGR
ncbi:YbfB/YjiJ family MFS transporter [Saccharopolyspora pogona]|uniref:YbfB/YjiJ family MFS transporter n=1 Tax=Saccharopolyspora pogona TaxID=333966 RepID=UPI001687136D|nr:YbfB/YjiJ family MFS transporter [Saccharopolyspora pogona]